MSSIHDIPFTLLTSFDLSHRELRQLPDSVTLVHHNLNIDTELDAAGKYTPPQPTKQTYPAPQIRLSSCESHQA